MNPYGIKPETGILQTLLDALPSYLNKDPQLQDAISLTYDGSACVVSIAQKQFSVAITAGTGESFVIDLAGKTITQVVAEVNTHAGFTATVLNDGPAISLLPVQGQDVFTSPKLSRFTSLLWCLLAPVAWQFEQQLLQQEAGLQQLTLKTAEGLWVDLWGDLYGEIVRLFNEEDRDYANRIMREVTRWRLNGLGIAEAIKDRFGADVVIINLHDKAWVYGRTPFGKYVGRKYARTTILVDPQEEIDPNFRVIVERNRAAGILPFYVFRGQGGARNGDRQWNGKGVVVSKAPLADVVYGKTLSAQAVSGQAVITLTDVSKVSANKRVKLINGATTETLTVLSVNVGLNQVTMTTNLSNTYPVTSQVVVYPYGEQSSMRWECPGLLTKKTKEQVFVGGSVAFTLGTSALNSTDVLGGVPAGAIALSDSASASQG